MRSECPSLSPLSPAGRAALCVGVSTTVPAQAPAADGEVEVGRVAEYDSGARKWLVRFGEPPRVREAWMSRQRGAPKLAHLEPIY